MTITKAGGLSGSECDVLDSLLSSKSNKEIVRISILSKVTLKYHLKNLRSKLGARNRTYAVSRTTELSLAVNYYVIT